MKKIRWGVLSTAKIGTKKVIPALQKGQYTTVTGIASRGLAKARASADALGIAKAYGSYEELLADPDIDAIYNPLPNHLHVEWSIKALQAGKHVLCEKPIGLSAAEGQTLVDAAKKYPQLKVMEGFMYRHHPQWVKARELVDSQVIGRLMNVNTVFSYFNDNPDNIRNIADLGGGALMDIGCYAISLSRFLFGAEPVAVQAQIDRDPTFGTDILSSGMLRFAAGTATFTCSTQMAPYQRVHIFGTKGRIELEIPFNAPPEAPTRLWLTSDGKTDEVVFPVCDQYTLQGDRMARAILDNTPVPTPIEDAVANMKVIEALIHRSQISSTRS